MVTSTTVTQPALRMTTKILPDHKIELQLPPDTLVGEEVDVVVVLSESSKVEHPKNSPEQPNSLEIIEEGRKHATKRTTEAIDRQIRAERDAWDS